MTRTMKIAYFSPLAPLHTGTSDYSEELLPNLCRRAHVDAYTDDRLAATQEVGRIYPLYGYRDFQRGRYDQLICQLGNSPEHRPVWDLFRRYGGVGVLHDLDLPASAGAEGRGKGDSWGPVRQVRLGEGLGFFLRTAGGALLRAGRPRPDSPPYRPPVEQADGLIVHSEWAREHLLAHDPELPVRHIPMGIPRPPIIDVAQARQLLHLPQEAFVCLSLGRLDPEKRIHVAMQAFARLLERWPDSLYILVGEPAPDYPLLEMAQTLGIAGKVRLTGYVERSMLYRYLAAADVGICLRSAKQCGISAGLLRTMSMGKAVIVSKLDPYIALPNDCTLKIDVGAGEMAQLVAALWALSSHPPMRQSHGRRAARFVQAQHSLTAAAQRYIDLVEELATVQAAEEILLRA